MDLEKTTRIYEEPAVNQVFKSLDRIPERGECRRKAGEMSAEIWRLSVQASVILCQWQVWHPHQHCGGSSSSNLCQAAAGADAIPLCHHHR